MFDNDTFSQRYDEKAELRARAGALAAEYDAPLPEGTPD